MKTFHGIHYNISRLHFCIEVKAIRICHQLLCEKRIHYSKGGKSATYISVPALKFNIYIYAAAPPSTVSALSAAAPSSAPSSTAPPPTRGKTEINPLFAEM